MMKSQLVRTLLKWLLAIAIVIGVLHLPAKREDDSDPLPATVTRDCAPWDGSAFTISIPAGDPRPSNVEISIWHSPDLAGPVIISFPDETGRDGTALYRPAFGDPQPMQGWASLLAVHGDHPVEGRFSLATENGNKFSGRFRATWGSEIIFCG